VDWKPARENMLPLPIKSDEASLRICMDALIPLTLALSNFKSESSKNKSFPSKMFI
jgi:hypothetical protein